MSPMGVAAVRTARRLEKLVATEESLGKWSGGRAVSSAPMYPKWQICAMQLMIHSKDPYDFAHRCCGATRVAYFLNNYFSPAAKTNAPTVLVIQASV